MDKIASNVLPHLCEEFDSFAEMGHLEFEMSKLNFSVSFQPNNIQITISIILT